MRVGSCHRSGPVSPLAPVWKHVSDQSRKIYTARLIKAVIRYKGTGSRTGAALSLLLEDVGQLRRHLRQCLDLFVPPANERAANEGRDDGRMAEGLDRTRREEDRRERSANLL
eukprot:CAMPEP_0115845842 /NCGR_PEP_ID=MMETSP0287-20121206/9561_1 /TAXON_ID=412157 /ORGANISM="Chrysochromulina rotalis, Strain UIO044" /LENGTH=112 /DNA_ID=CAMNT_0003299629 /DNA_START=382 /DNA_END=720 /DNA_ORIENTATION=-